METTRLLLVEDDPDLLLTTRLVLERQGFTVVTAADGLQALDALGREPVDAAVIDIVMPHMDGLTLTRRIRATPSPRAPAGRAAHCPRPALRPCERAGRRRRRLRGQALRLRGAGRTDPRRAAAASGPDGRGRAPRRPDPRPTRHDRQPRGRARAVERHRVPPARDPRRPRRADAAADYLTHFRADEIVNDCEAIRQALGAEQWTVLGQSFGGFTSLHYLSVRPESLSGAIITGGLSAVQRPIEDVYAATWQIMITKSEQYYQHFPGDRDRIRELTRLAAAGEIRLPNGDVVSPDRLRTLGHRLGMQGGPEQLHYLLDLDHTSPAFAHDLAAALPFGGRNPLYAVFHESSYADGVRTRWAADRTMPDHVREDPTLFAGEHLHRSLFGEASELEQWAETADLLAEHDWPQLYFPERLREADVPVAAAVYSGDAYVPLEFSLETAGMLPDCRTWVTSEFEHNGLRVGEAVLDRLIDLLHGRRWL